jgi:hypothetical protein
VVEYKILFIVLFPFMGMLNFKLLVLTREIVVYLQMVQILMLSDLRVSLTHLMLQLILQEIEHLQGLQHFMCQQVLITT